METEPIKRAPLTAIGAFTVHPKRQNISFGRWAMPVMAEKMQDSDPLDRRRAVQSLCDYVFDSRRVASKEFASVVPYLKDLHKDENNEVRLKVAECFCAIVATAAGRRTFDKFGFYKEALELLDDEQESVREAANVAIQRVSLSPICIESLVKAGAIRRLVNRIPHEEDNILEIILRSLHACCLLNSEEALEAKGLEVLIPLLERTSSRVRERAATVIKDLTVEEKGRFEALELSALTPLLNLCLEKDDRVKAKALAAIMMILNTTKGKFLALENEAIEKVFSLTKSEDAEVRFNAIKVLTALSEAPEGRNTLSKQFRTIVSLLNDDYTEIKKAVRKLIAVVTFTP